MSPDRDHFDPKGPRVDQIVRTVLHKSAKNNTSTSLEDKLIHKLS